MNRNTETATTIEPRPEAPRLSSPRSRLLSLVAAVVASSTLLGSVVVGMTAQDAPPSAAPTFAQAE